MTREVLIMMDLTYKESSETSSETDETLNVIVKEGNRERGENGQQRECDVTPRAKCAVDAQYDAKVVPQRNSEQRTAIGQTTTNSQTLNRNSKFIYKLDVRQTAGRISRKLASRGGVPLSLTKSREYRS